MKKIILLLIASMGLLMSGCADEGLIRIGILQYLEHNALSAARLGFIEGLAEAGYVEGVNVKFDILNPQGDEPTMEIQAKSLLRRSDLILAIATPAASSVVNKANELGKDTPILFTAVTDPVDAKLIASNEKPGKNVTGTNDMNPIAEQISLVKRLLPSATKLGILYTASETNSELQANLAKDFAEAAGLSVSIKTIESVNDLQLVAGQLALVVDALYIPTDNAIVGAMEIINDIILERRIPAIVGEPNAVESGGSISYGVDYYELGKLTAQMAVRILRDKAAPSDIPSIGLTSYELIINKSQLEAIGLNIPGDLLAEANRLIEN